MIKNDINLIYKRKAKQYSTKNLLIGIGVIAVIGIGAYFGITMPTKTLANTKAVVNSLENEILEYTALALSESDMDSLESGDTQSQSKMGLDDLLIAKATTLSDLDEQLDGLKLIATAESNALVYIRAIEDSIPNEVNISSLEMAGQKLTIFGISSNDTALATFCLRLRETSMFIDVFVSSTTTMVPGEKTAIFNIITMLAESMDAMSMSQEEAIEISTVVPVTEEKR